MLCARIAQYTPLKRNELTISQTAGHCDAMAATVFHNLLKGEFRTHPLITFVVRLVDVAIICWGSEPGSYLSTAKSYVCSAAGRLYYLRLHRP